MELQHRLVVVGGAWKVAIPVRSAMASSLEYRRYMDECLRAAAKAKSEEERRSLLQLAQTWHEAINLEASAELVKQSVTVSAPQTQQAGP
jgi:hypothetical protein